MFVNAFNKISDFTRPVVLSYLECGGTHCINGTAILINKDGWFLTAGHLVQQYHQLILHDKSCSPSERKYPSLWLGDGVNIHPIHYNMDIDIALMKANGSIGKVMNLPIFAKDSEVQVCKSVCRVGYPFSEISSSCNIDDHGAHYSLNILEMPLIPNEGIITRSIHTGKKLEFDSDPMEIETSSPGLKGQSGGPIFDYHGHILGMQTKTQSRPSGFRLKVPNENGELVEENQLLSFGQGIHVSTICKFMNHFNVKYRR